jgi:hypothetical protein
MAVPRARRFGAMLCVLLAGVGLGLVGCSKKKPKVDAGESQQPTNGSSTVAGPLGTGVNLPLVNPPEPRLNFDVAALGYDPYKPDMTVSVLDWPRRLSRVAQIPESYFGKIITTKGRVALLNGSDEKDKNVKPTGRLLVRVNLADPGGKLADDNGKAYFITVHLHPSQDWHKCLPGRIIKVAGRAGDPTSKSRTSLFLLDAVLLSVEGDEDPSMTPEEAVQNYPKMSSSPYRGTVVETYTILTGVVSTKQIPSNEHNLYVYLVYGDKGVDCMVHNKAEYHANPPRPGDTVKVVGKVSYNSVDRRLFLTGLYHSKK